METWEVFIENTCLCLIQIGESNNEQAGICFNLFLIEWTRCSPCRSADYFLNSTDYFSFNLVVFNLFRLEIVPTLLHVFVDIEATGQAVQFEMKFSYRRPMVSISTNSSI